MPCAVQQSAHICLVSPSNIDHQHACEIRNSRGHFDYHNNANYKEKSKEKNNHHLFHIEIHVYTL